MKKEAALLVAGVIFVTGAAAQMYKCPDQFGRTIIQQMPCDGGAKMDSRPGSWSDRELRVKIEERKRKEELEKAALKRSEMREKLEKEDEERRQKLEKRLEEKRQRENEALERREKACAAIGVTPTTPLRIGMTKQQVSCVTRYEKPTKINTTQTAAGLSEQVIYEKGWGTEYLYFDNGVLTTIQKLD